MSRREGKMDTPDRAARRAYQPTPTIIEADVLVIGGGFAGCFAAINAAEAGAKVLMAVKGRTGRSGLTPWANSWFVFRDTFHIRIFVYGLFVRVLHDSSFLS